MPNGKKRKYRNVHEWYLAEYLGMNYPPGTWMTNVSLGKVQMDFSKLITKEEAAYISRPLAAKADAIILLPAKVIIIECMIRHEPGALEDLVKYGMLFRETPQFKAHWNKPIELVLLTPLDAPFYERLAKKFGIRVEKYKPAWIFEYLHSYPRKYWRGKLTSVEFPKSFAE